MKSALTEIAKAVRTVFLVPYELSSSGTSSLVLSSSLPDQFQATASAFFENLNGVIRTLSIPFQYTHSQVNRLHWQRLNMAARIRALEIEGEGEREIQSRKATNEAFEAFLKGEGTQIIIEDVLSHLKRLSEEPESLAAARELTRQGVVLVWSAIEVLARDSFILLLNKRPALAERLLSEAVNRKRFSVERVDWQTLSTYNYSLSESMGTFLISKADLTSVPALRDAYGALFPNAKDLRDKLADRRLWDLCQKRNLIVHRRGVVDHQYLANTVDDIPLGADLWITPGHVESFLAAAHDIGIALIAEISRELS